ncbi:hypothetical protein M9H77_23589 [Catharanthus roseus]|uniref:Uncharacterized protein n=1 Tax=Catharanthus roseus TaxID=4058 RepID=A0ACC0AUG3_CATRO|nr:hypothetical protein M9H77_23589 [Catharanthus roseus]
MNQLKQSDSASAATRENQYQLKENPKTQKRFFTGPRIFSNSTKEKDGISMDNADRMDGCLTEESTDTYATYLYGRGHEAITRLGTAHSVARFSLSLVPIFLFPHQELGEKRKLGQKKESNCPMNRLGWFWKGPEHRPESGVHVGGPAGCACFSVGETAVALERTEEELTPWALKSQCAMFSRTLSFQAKID